MKEVQTGYIIFKDELTKLESVPKLHYVGTIRDVIYDFDTERIWWRKEKQDVGANKAIRYNVLEAAVIGFQMADVESGGKSTRKPWMCDFDFETKESGCAAI
eukprot:gene23600-28584_t